MAGARGVRVRVRPARKPRPRTRPDLLGAVEEALEVAIAEAGDRLTPMDEAGLAAARVLARMVDNFNRPVYDDDGHRRPLDNVTLPTFLKYLDAYGLTVAARKAAEASSTGKPVGRPTKLASVSSLLPGQTG